MEIDLMETQEEELDSRTEIGDIEDYNYNVGGSKDKVKMGNKDMVSYKDTLVPSYDEEEDWSFFGVSVHKVQNLMREFSVFFILMETGLFLLGYCVIFSAHFTLRYGYSCLTTGRSSQHNQNRRLRQPPLEGPFIIEDFNNNLEYFANHQILPVVVPRTRMAGG